MKTRILFCGESSFLSTGFATYNRELLKRLHATGKFEVAEMGSYGLSNDERAISLPWKFYGVLPTNENEQKIYQSDRSNEFGGYKFDAIVADFQPDIVFDGRDPWMLGHLIGSRFRGNYKLILVPTVDSEPQKKEWVENIFKKADVLCTYSKFGKRVLEQDKAKVSEVLSPGSDLDVFRPLNKKELRKKWCLNSDMFIFGTVMRNQKRKLFPDLFEAYAMLRNRNLKDEAIQKSVLLCHTSYPDLGWDIPELVYRSNMQRHIIFTYMCDSCNASFISWFIPTDNRGLGPCIVCGQNAAHMPNTHKGLKQDELVEIYNLMDLYIQPAICEGWGVPIVEAKSCGVPGLYSNFSAMEDHVNNGGGMGIEIDRIFTEAETMAWRSMPDRADLSNKMKMLLKDSNRLGKMSIEARKCAEQKHDWKITSDKLIKLVDNLELHNREKTWDAFPQERQMNMKRPPNGLSDPDFVRWCYINILGRKYDDKGMHDWLTSLKNGASRDSVEQFFRNEIQSFNIFENIRWAQSLKNRGLKEESKPSKPTNLIPGILI